MILISEIIQRTQSAYSKGVESKDSRLTDRHIYSADITARANLIRNQSSKTQYQSNWVYQTLPYVALEKVSIHELSFVPKGCIVLKSVKPLPKLISDIDAELFRSITSLDGLTSITMTRFDTMQYNSGNKFTAKNPRAYIRKGYLYVTIYTQLEAITIDGIFEDPIEVYQFNLDAYPDCTDCICKSAYDIEFPIDRNLMNALIKLANEELILLFTQMSEDDTNNASDDGESKNIVHSPQQQQQQP